MQRMFDILFSGIVPILLPLLLPMMFILRVTGEEKFFSTESCWSRWKIF